VNIFKAFAQIGSLVDNTLGVVSPIGELADRSKTAAREKTWHSFSDFGAETLVGFSYKVNDVPTVVTDAIAFQCLTAINWIYTQAKLGTFTEEKDSFTQAFITRFGTQFDLIDSGIQTAFGNYFCPEYINIAPLNQSATTSWRIWFADESFYNQYDEFTILPVPPVVALDSFFDDYDAVLTMVQAIQQSDIFNRMNIAKGVFPETVMRNDVFAWTDPTDKTKTIDTNWVTVIYGPAGDNLDAVKEAIRDYILDNSEHDRDDWATIFPDLFTSTEFIATPLYMNWAVPQEVRQTGIWAGIAGVQQSMKICHKTCKGVKYTDAHIDKVLNIVPSQFRSVMLAVVGGPENRNGIDQFIERYPDYINVPTTHVDFMQMKEETRQFCMMLAEMLMHAEEMTRDSGVPTGFNRLIRDDVVYIAKSFNKFLYLVVTKYSVDIAQATIPVTP